MFYKSLSIILVLSSFVFFLSLTPTNGQFDDLCLECICNVTSGCTVEKSRECFNGVCGIFRITQPYWVDAGKPVVTGDNPESASAYQNCVTDINCSASAVRGYMNRFEQDCDRNGIIDCIDYGSIHILGGYGCGAGLPANQLRGLQQCSYSRK